VSGVSMVKVSGVSIEKDKTGILKPEHLLSSLKHAQRLYVFNQAGSGWRKG
jgi:hypothetical protein